MSIKRFCSYKIENEDLVYKYIDENNKVQVDKEPLRLFGKRNNRIDAIIEGVKQTVAEVEKIKKTQLEEQLASQAIQYLDEDENALENKEGSSKDIPTDNDETAEPVVIPDDATAETDLEDEEVLEGEEIAEEQEKQEAEYEEVEPAKKKKWLKKAGKIALVAVIALAIAAGVKSCMNSKNKVATLDDTQSPTPTVTTIDDLKEDSRYTEITENILIETTEDFIKELADHGITVTASDALTYVTVANITHLKETNPELLNKVLEGMDEVETLSKTGHIIGQIVTNEVTTKDDTVDWTIAFMDETDRKIAAHGAGYVIEGSKKIAADETLKEDEKISQIQTLVAEKFVAPNFDKTVGYTFNDESKITLSQEDGADFISDAIITGVLMGDNTLKNYINAENKYEDTKDSTWVTTTSYGEISADLKAISENADNVSNLMRIIEECQSLESNQASIETTKTK